MAVKAEPDIQWFFKKVHMEPFLILLAASHGDQAVEIKP